MYDNLSAVAILIPESPFNSTTDHANERKRLMTSQRLPGFTPLLVFAIASACLLISFFDAQAGVEIEHLMKIEPPAQILDSAASSDGKLIFTLTPGKIYVYSGSDATLLDQISVDQKFVRLTPLEGNRLLLFSNTPPLIDILKVDRIYDINTTGRAFKGAENAKVTLAVFDDYQCPYCSRLEPELDRILKKYPDQVKLVVKHFPIPSHRFAFQAAMAALAAGNQGKFWEFHQALFQNYNALNDKKIGEIAENLALDKERFENDLKSPENRELIIQDMKEGQEIDVRGTPTIFMNGKKVDNRNFRKLPDMIHEILSRQK